MKTTTLMNALEYYLQSADCLHNDDYEDALASIRALSAVMERSQYADNWNHRAFVVTAHTMDGVLNALTYDTYGKLARTNGGHAAFRQYALSCRASYSLEELTDEQLSLGYDIVSDLWTENERTGHNNPDGTFRLDGDPTLTKERLQDYKNWFTGLLGPEATEEAIEQLYNDYITISVAGKSISLPFDAENYNNVETVLQRAIEEW